MPNEAKLLPCPFCNHDDELQISHIGAADEWWWEVFCDHCCTHGPTAATEAEAIAAWNTRPTIVTDEVVEPIPMMLFCPKCGLQHIDAPDERTPDWTNPPHKSHLCHGCGTIWRPADVPTEGVAAIQSRGSKDTIFYNHAAIAAMPAIVGGE